MSWADARRRIAEVLGEVSITEPQLTKLERVYEFPPETVQDVPAVIMFPPSVPEIQASPGRRRKNYDLRLRLLFRDEDRPIAAHLTDSFRESIIDAFHDDIQLMQTASLSGVLRVEDVSGFTYSGQDFIGSDMVLRVLLVEGYNYG